MQKSIAHTLIPSLVALIALGVIGYFGLEYLTLQKQTARSNAVDGCMANSVYRNVRETAEGTVTTEDSIDSSVKKCLELKGFSL